MGVALAVFLLGSVMIALVAAWQAYGDAKWAERLRGVRTGRHRPERIGSTAGRVIVFGRGFGQCSYYRSTDLCTGRISGDLVGSY